MKRNWLGYKGNSVAKAADRKTPEANHMLEQSARNVRRLIIKRMHGNPTSEGHTTDK